MAKIVNVTDKQGLTTTCYDLTKISWAHRKDDITIFLVIDSYPVDLKYADKETCDRNWNFLTTNLNELNKE